MPPNNHLQWTEVRDFTKGLWDEDDFSMPLGAAAELVDYYPLPQGGLRAWFQKFQDVSTTGIVDASNEHVVAAFVRGGISKRVGSGTAPDRYLITANVSDLKNRVYRMDETNGDTSWSVIKTSAAASSVGPRSQIIRHYVDTSGVDYVIFSIGEPGMSDYGIYSVKYSDGTVTLLKAADGPFVIAQARVIVAQGAHGQSDRIYWTDPGTFTFAADNFLDVEPNQTASRIRLMEAFTPGDLLIGKEGAPWVQVQGDIEDPTVFQMAPAPAVGQANQRGILTPDGMAFLANDRDLYLTQNAGSFQNLSPQLARLGLVNGTGDFYDQWLLVPNGYVLDWETKAWFQASDLNDLTQSAHHSIDYHTAEMFVATEGVDFALYDYKLDSTIADRADAAHWKSGPIRNPDAGRQIEIREVQVTAKTWQANSTIAVTVGGVTVTVTHASSGRNTSRHLFVARGETLDVKVAGAAADTSHEAPMIEVVRIGWRNGALTA